MTKRSRICLPLGMVAIVPPSAGRDAVTGGADVEAEQPRTDIQLNFGLGPARLLEVVDVELLAAEAAAMAAKLSVGRRRPGGL